MLQIATGMYFAGAECWETRQRAVFYTNAQRARADDLDVVIGTLEFESGFSEVQAVAVSAVDRLPKKNPDGSDSIQVATSGDELLDDVADVAAFVWNVIVTRDVDVARRVIGTTLPGSRRSSRLRSTFTPQRFVHDADVDDLGMFSTTLLALRRPHFEAAMRAIRRIIDAASLAATDVTLSYSLYVAALESLSKDADVPPPTWDNYDGNRRRLVDGAIEGLPDDRVEAIRSAVLAIDSLSLRRKFQAFVLDHVEPSFYGREAVGASHPIRAVDLPRALDFAYQVRSISLHEMRDLAPELWALSSGDDTVWANGRWMLGLEGLDRLARHVVRRFVERAPGGVDSEFDYRGALPGHVTARLAPQYWLGNQDSFGVDFGPTLFEGLVEMLCAAGRGDADSLVDLRKPLQRAEQLLPAEAKIAARRPIVAAYVLWHRCLDPQFHRPTARATLERFGTDLNGPSLEGFVMAVMLRVTIDWPTDDLVTLAAERRAKLLGRKVEQGLPFRLDAALELLLATRLLADGIREQAAQSIGRALELSPGDKVLISVLDALSEHTLLPSIDLYAFVVHSTPVTETDGADSEAGPDQVTDKRQP